MITARQDRKNLGMSFPEYQRMAEALSNHCYLNKEGQMVKIAKAKRKKLKNLRHQISMNKLKATSPIYRELIRLITIQIEKCERGPRL